MSDLTSLLHNSVIALAEASVPVDGPVIMFQELRSMFVSLVIFLGLCITLPSLQNLCEIVKL